MDVKRKSARPVYDERFDRFGVYVWITDDGKVVTNQDGDYMYIAGEYGDMKRVKQIAQAAKSFGIPGGHARFMPGSHPVTDEEYEEQLWRLENGFIPDPYDLSAIVEEAEQKHGKRF